MGMSSTRSRTAVSRRSRALSSVHVPPSWRSADRACSVFMAFGSAGRLRDHEEPPTLGISSHIYCGTRPTTSRDRDTGIAPSPFAKVARSSNGSSLERPSCPPFGLKNAGAQQGAHPGSRSTAIAGCGFSSPCRLVTISPDVLNTSRACVIRSCAGTDEQVHVMR